MTTAIRKNSLEAAILAFLPDTSENARYRVMAHELWRDGESWTSNNRFQLARNADVETVLEIARGRWETFKLNYSPRATVKSLNDIGYDSEVSLEADYLPFLDITLLTPNPELMTVA